MKSEKGQSLVVVLILLALVIAVLIILGVIDNPLQVLTITHECGPVQSALSGCK